MDYEKLWRTLKGEALTRKRIAAMMEVSWDEVMDMMEQMEQEEYTGGDFYLETDGG
ncbi:hypothetical protein LQE92_08960 [Lacrimispora sp. NSJ-141]|uniref:Uncharacterized protein n=1 Tax=Lientehia hominis TaxID=2897778 RepID=A0AAP2RIS9_9FIRM|nr:hypothetical protein [Lientehia hominis]MCD2492757.1 hypothetical protein [Lientehia hominis]